MHLLNLPQYHIKTGGTPDKPTIFDDLRRRYIALTPEEWVRQHFIHFLIEHKGFPKQLLANEVEVRIGVKKLRCDSLLYDKHAKPRMIIEYKAPSIKITQKVFDQITAYNFILKVDYLIVSNGITHFFCKIDHATKRYLIKTEIPDYTELV